MNELTDLTIECNNLFNLTKLVVKDILRTAVKLNRKLDEDNSLIIQLIRVLEGVTLHGMRPKKLLNSLTVTGLSTSADPWPMICDILRHEKCSDIIESVQQMGLKSGILKFRAWIKLSLMQKQLGEYFRILTDKSGSAKLDQYYFPAAILLSDKGTEISGLLVGLSIIECNFYKFRDNLPESESLNNILNYSRYMIHDDDTNDNCENDDDEEDSKSKMTKLLDDKKYVEELNSVLETKQQKLQEANNKLEKESESVKMKLTEQIHKNLSLVEETEKLQKQIDGLHQKYNHHSKLMKDDLEVERATYQTSRQELYQMNLELEGKVKKEQQLREEAEKNVDKIVRKKGEVQQSMEAYEKQIEEKQQLIFSVRKQVEHIKQANLELNAELQDKLRTIDQKTKLIEKLEEKTNGMSKIIDQMDQRIKSLNAEKECMGSVVLNLQEENQHLLEDRAQDDSDKKSYIGRIEELSKELDLLKEEKHELNQQIAKLNQQIEFLDSANRQLKITYQEQAEALGDMAKLVEESKLESHRLKEIQMTIQEGRWTDDKTVNECVQCSLAFNVTRRKHHCRRCGGVFCHDCSSNRMPLASSAKPMRVCDTCLHALMENYTNSNSKASLDTVPTMPSSITSDSLSANQNFD